MYASVIFTAASRCVRHRSGKPSWPFTGRMTTTAAAFTSRSRHSSTGMDHQRQNSNYPSRVYPRLESVDLHDDTPRISPTPSLDLLIKDIDFEDHNEAFRAKTTWEILRALSVLRMCGSDMLVNNSLEVMSWTRRVCGRHVLRALFKPMFYNQFVGGETPQEILACVRRLAECGTRTMLAATMEEDVGEGGNETVYDSNCQRIIESLEIATAEDTPSPMIQLKMSGLLPADLLVIVGKLYQESHDKLKLIEALGKGMSDGLLEMDSFLEVLDENQRAIFQRAVERLKKIGEEAQRKGVKILVDAEYTYLNGGLSLLTMAMISVFNKTSPLIWNTYQCYLKDARSKVDEEIALASKMGCCFGAKVVRGAYVLQERTRAQRMQLPDPICDDYHATSANYNKIMTFLLEYASKMGSRCTVSVATHNEQSVKIAIEKMKQLGIDPQHGGVCFGQLYGMCDQVTSPLANCGYSVYKSIPYGTLEEVLPYLARRATENKSVLQGARKEKDLLWKELKSRMIRKMRCRSTPQAPSST